VIENNNANPTGQCSASGVRPTYFPAKKWEIRWL